MTEMIEKNQAIMAPDFTAADTEGKTVQLAAFKGQKNVVLVFNRGFF
jgi:peroxiredoxin